MSEAVKYDVIGKRPDSMGFFWEEPAKIHVPKVKIKREPPEPTWLDPSYMPHLETAQAWNPPLFTWDELWLAAEKRERLLFDIEVFADYFLVMFKSIESGKFIWFERNAVSDFHLPALQHLLERFCIIGFNSFNYDLPILALALGGYGFKEFEEASTMLTRDRLRPWQVLREYKCASIDVDHIDLIEVAPLFGSLKIYGGRCHTQRMQDLPFPVMSSLASREKESIVRWYCANDLGTTEDLYNELKKDIELRESLGAQYGVELRSRSDAQIAESVISKEIEVTTGVRPTKPTILPLTSYFYQPPSFLDFKTDLMKWVLNKVISTRLVVGESGSIVNPPELKALKFRLGHSEYQMGIGGLHSCESKQAIFADKDYCLLDRDVASYYPFIILNLGLFPEHLGSSFLQVYRKIVARRLEAKRNGNKKVADSLKITINGTFGKLGNKYSIMYDPRLVPQVTITGQLSLLYLIEKVELAGVRVVSANTDGLVMRPARCDRERLEAIIGEWESETGFETEETEYHALLSRDVNNYIAVKVDGSVKGKGTLGRGITKLFKNPVNSICLTAVEEFLSRGVPIESTIRNCRDVREFVSVRTVKGGAVWQGQFLGKAIRWYYANGLEDSEIVYAMSGNKVPRTEGARPLMRLPDELPPDINYDWYLWEAYEMLAGTGYPVNLQSGPAE